MARSKREFSYDAPSYEETVSRADQKGSAFDSMFKDVTFFTPPQGTSTLRILPPGWKGARHYGFTVFIHNQVGPNNKRYLCLEQNEDSPHKRCPVCEELRRIRNPTPEDKKAYNAQQRVAYYVINRDAEKDGVLLWLTSARNDSEIAAQSVNRRSKSVLNIVHPDNGYDIEFTRKGTTQTNTKYFGFQVMRDDSPLAENEKNYDKWLDVAFETPLPSLLQFYSPETIAKAMGGVGEDDEDERPRRRSRDEDEDESPRRRTSARDDEDDEDEQPKTRRRPVKDEDEDVKDEDEDEEEKPRHRSRLAEDIDDEIPEKGAPFEGGKRRTQVDEDDDDEDEQPRRRAKPRHEDEDEDEKPSRRSRKASDDDDEEEAPRTRRRPSRNEEDEDEDEPEEKPARRRAAAKDEDDEDDEIEAKKERLRSRLKR